MFVQLVAKLEGVHGAVELLNGLGFERAGANFVLNKSAAVSSCDFVSLLTCPVRRLKD